MTPKIPKATGGFGQSSVERVQCAPLMDTVSSDLYRRNGFRITGLAVDATAKQVSKRGEKLKLMEELGQGAGANTNAFPIEPPPSVDDIREALQRLKDPEVRLIDEFFWFWPEGSSESDEAIQAYLTGSGEKAFDLWHGRRGTDDKGIIAYHNLAVMNHMMAMEWTTRYLDVSPDDGIKDTIAAYWTTALRYWRRVTDNDAPWDALKERIRILDDPRLTTGLARRIRTVLPEALASINALFALKLAERGQLAATEAHVKYVQAIGIDGDLRDEIFVRALKPTCDRFSAQINDVRKNQADLKKRFASAQHLMTQASSVSHLLEIFFGKSSHHRTELLDEAVTACANANNDYVKEAQDWEAYTALARQSLPFATGQEIRERVRKNIDVGENAIVKKAFEPFLNNLQQIVSGPQPPIVKLAAVKTEIMPRLAKMVRESGPLSIEAQELQNEVAEAVRNIGIDAANNHQDIATAQEATKLASKLHRDPERQKQLAEDKKILDNLTQEQAKRSVDLELRSSFIFGGPDRFIINRQFVQYKQTRIPTAEINGVRYGIFRQYRNGLLTRASFTVGLHSSRGIKIDVEVKRPFVSEYQAQQDYEAILKGLFFNVIPDHAMRCARFIITTGLRLGASTMTADGMTLASNRLFGSDEVFVPYSEINYGFHQGQLNVAKTNENRIRRSFIVRDCWNAAIFEQILKAIPIVKNQK